MKVCLHSCACTDCDIFCRTIPRIWNSFPPKLGWGQHDDPISLPSHSAQSVEELSDFLRKLALRSIDNADLVAECHGWLHWLANYNSILRAETGTQHSGKYPMEKLILAFLAADCLRHRGKLKRVFQTRLRVAFFRRNDMLLCLILFSLAKCRASRPYQDIS